MWLKFDNVANRGEGKRAAKEKNGKKHTHTHVVAIISVNSAMIFCQIISNAR